MRFQRHLRTSDYCNTAVISCSGELVERLEVSTCMQLLRIDILAALIMPFAGRYDTAALAHDDLP